VTVDPARARAPELHGAGGWINADPLALADLRGKLVLLHFWTAGCVNCLHVAEGLRGLERRYADVLVVVGVHSPRFPHERAHDAVRAAVARHRIEHPVLDDPQLATWDAYAVRAWPTLVLVDAAGRVALSVAGEGHGAQLADAIDTLCAEAEAAGVLRRGRLHLAPESAGTGELAFPGKVAVDAGATMMAIADTGHDRVLVTTLGGEVLHELGGLYQPQGVRFDGPDAVLVCETAADRVWRIVLRNGVGDGGARTLLTDRLKSPWDVVRWHAHVVIAEAGRHRLWAIDRDGEPQVIAGAGGENLADGPALEALLAQPSGIAVTAEDELVFADAEASALRILNRPGGRVRTLVGHGLFVSGADDGDALRATLQHALGVARAPDGALVVADTYNGLIRVWRGEHLWTLPVEGFDEPGGVDVLPDGRLVVADTGNHRVVLVDPLGDPPLAEAIDVGGSGSGDVAGPAAWASQAVAGTLIAEAGSTLDVELDLPLDGDALDPGGGAPVRVTAVASDPAVLAGPASWELATLPARVAVPLGTGSGRVTVELRVATCDGDLCRLRRTQRAYDVILT
jgi:thiol-disulfide isomerase/thioredoxin